MMPPKGALISVLASRAAASSASAWATLKVFSASSLRLAGNEALGSQVLGAFELGARQREVGAGALQVGALDGIVQADEPLAALHPLALLEGDLRHAAGDLGADDHGLVGAQAPHGGDGAGKPRARTGGRASTAMPAGWPPPGPFWGVPAGRRRRGGGRATRAREVGQRPDSRKQDNGADDRDGLHGFRPETGDYPAFAGLSPAFARYGRSGE